MFDCPQRGAKCNISTSTIATADAAYKRNAVTIKLRNQEIAKNEIWQRQWINPAPIPGWVANSQISSTEAGVCSSGAWSTITVEPTMHSTHPRIPILCSLSFNMKCAKMALQIFINVNNLGHNWEKYISIFHYLAGTMSESCKIFLLPKGKKTYCMIFLSMLGLLIL